MIKKPLDATIIEEVKLRRRRRRRRRRSSRRRRRRRASLRPAAGHSDDRGDPEAAITAVTPGAADRAAVIAPPSSPPPPPPPPKPAIRRGIQRIAGEDPEFPKAAIKDGVDKGKVVARLMIDEKGNVTDVVIVRRPAAVLRPRGDRRAQAVEVPRRRREVRRRAVEINFKLAD